MGPVPIYHFLLYHIFSTPWCLRPTWVLRTTGAPAHGRSRASCELTFQVADLFEVTINSVLQLLSFSLMNRWTGFSAHVCVFECADAVVKFGLDHVGQILVIKLFHVAGLAALDCVVVQIDLDLTCTAVEVVKMFCSF